MPLVADIVGISAPQSAKPGDTVTVTVSVKNLAGWSLIMGGFNHIAVTAVFDSISLPIQPDYLYGVPPGVTVTFSGNFTMPSKGVRVTAWSWYWDGSKWVYDDTAYVDIALTAVITQPEFAGFAIASYDRQ